MFVVMFQVCFQCGCAITLLWLHFAFSRSGVRDLKWVIDMSVFTYLVISPSMSCSSKIFSTVLLIEDLQHSIGKYLLYIFSIRAHLVVWYISLLSSLRARPPVVGSGLVPARPHQWAPQLRKCYIKPRVPQSAVKLTLLHESQALYDHSWMKRSSQTRSCIALFSETRLHKNRSCKRFESNHKKL